MELRVSLMENPIVIIVQNNISKIIVLNLCHIKKPMIQNKEVMIQGIKLIGKRIHAPNT
jgi:hypothetical protein